MRTASLVQASADVVTIVNLRAGDVYKRLEENTYGEKYQLHFGVVQDVMHNGEDAVITAIEFPAQWNGVEAKIKVFGTGSDLKLFEATPEEVTAHFAEVREASQRSVKTKADELSKAEATHRQVEGMIRKVGIQALTAPRTEVRAIDAATDEGVSEVAEELP
jgi:hypothetical protein